jgi:hypothetical protein
MHCLVRGELSVDQSNTMPLNLDILQAVAATATRRLLLS